MPIAFRPFFAAIAALLFVQVQHAAAEVVIALPDGEVCTDAPFTLVDNRAFADVIVNGKGPYKFVFDTGASNVLNAELAKELALPEVAPRTQTGGAGAGTQETGLVKVASAQLGGVTVSDAEFLVLSLEEIRKTIGFKRMDGLMGREVMAALLVRYDFDLSVLTFCDPERAPAFMRAGTAMSYTTEPFNIPVIEAEVDGRAAKLMIDTGDRSSLTLFTPFAAKHGLRNFYAPKVSAITGRGVGGPIPADVAKVRSLRFAGFDVPGVTMRMPTLTSGGFTSGAISGSIGTGVIRLFNVTFDHAGRRIFLAPNAHFARPDRYDRSGMWIVGSSDGFEILSVVADSGADRAGIKIGDKITAVDGKSWSEFDLVALRDRLMDDPPGTTVRLQISGQYGGARGVEVVLRDLI
jgi:predicted aspartyl protease